MAYRTAYEILCSCGEKFTAQLCEYVFAEYDPQLRDALLAGELNVVTCPSCAQALPVENRVLYRDEKNRLWVWMCPRDEEPRRQELEEKLLDGKHYFEDHFLDAKNEYTKYLVFGRNALVALLLREDPELKTREGRQLKRNPALRLVMEGNREGLLFLSGEKVKVAVPLTLPPGEEPERWPPEAKADWLDQCSRGANTHNPFSSFLPSSMKKGWEKILKDEPAEEFRDGYEDFAHSWAGYERDPGGYRDKRPMRAGFLDKAGSVKVTREICPIGEEVFEET